MRYVSTRGKAPALPFDEALLAGLAEDGGLYVPETWPSLSTEDLRVLRGLPYDQLAVRVMSPFLGGKIAEDEFAAMVAEAYGQFRHRAVTPLRQLTPDLWLMELFHGPTLAFKDVAMQLLGRLFDHVLKRRGERVTIIGATSGDTGSAAIEACRDREAIELFVLFPQGRVSEVQRRQMTTVASSNVHAIAVEGTFDDCQDLVKAMFGDANLRRELRLSAVNSINWARVMAQTVYYVHAGLSLGAPDRSVAFAVPTGNFGNVYAGYGARAMGLPIDRLIVGSNRNDILTRFVRSGDMSIEEVHPTLSPSMDIQVSSNFERLLFDLFDRDGDAVTRAMSEFRETGRLPLERRRWNRVTTLFSAHSIDDARTRDVIAEWYTGNGEMLDPHTAVGVEAARVCRGGRSTPVVALATAHPAKFPDAVRAAIGREPELPPALADLYKREERVTVLPKDFSTLRAFIRGQVALKGAA